MLFYSYLFLLYWRWYFFSSLRPFFPIYVLDTISSGLLLNLDYWLPSHYLFPHLLYWFLPISIQSVIKHFNHPSTLYSFSNHSSFPTNPNCTLWIYSGNTLELLIDQRSRKPIHWSPTELLLTPLHQGCAPPLHNQTPSG